MKPQPFYVYSQTKGLYLSVVIGVLGLAGAVYLGLTQYGASAILTTPGLLFLGMMYGVYDYWRKPLRKAAFYDNHFEISGHGVNINSGYEIMEGLEKVKNFRGSSAHSVVFSVKNSTRRYRIPYRATATLPDLYSVLADRTHPGKTPSIREFLLENEPRSDEERTLLVANYLDSFRLIRNFTAIDLEKGFDEAGEVVPRNLQAKIEWNIRKGFLMEADSSIPNRYFVTTSGKSEVHPLVGAHLNSTIFYGSIGVYILGIVVTFVIFGYTVNAASFFLILLWILAGGAVLSWYLWHRREQ